MVNRQEHYRKAEEALARAFELHPDIAIGHHVQATIELDRGRTEAAIDRLLAVLERNPNDVGSYVQLMVGFRYLGLLDESLAAYRRARELDPEVRTSLIHTLDALGDLEGALAEAQKHDRFEVSMVLFEMGRNQEAIEVAEEQGRLLGNNSFGEYLRAVKGAIQGDVEVLRSVYDHYLEFPDPEGHYLVARTMARSGQRDFAIDLLGRAIGNGYANLPLIARDPCLDPVRDDPRFGPLFRKAEEHHAAARAAYGGRVR